MALLADTAAGHRRWCARWRSVRIRGSCSGSSIERMIALRDGAGPISDVDGPQRRGRAGVPRARSELHRLAGGHVCVRFQVGGGGPDAGDRRARDHRLPRRLSAKEVGDMTTATPNTADPIAITMIAGRRGREGFLIGSMEPGSLVQRRAARLGLRAPTGRKRWTRVVLTRVRVGSSGPSGDGLRAQTPDLRNQAQGARPIRARALAPDGPVLFWDIGTIGSGVRFCYYYMN